jgi:hypothetical protein
MYIPKAKGLLPCGDGCKHGAQTTIPDWRERLVCGQCGSLNVDMVVTGTERRQRGFDPS